MIARARPARAGSGLGRRDVLGAAASACASAALGLPIASCAPRQAARRAGSAAVGPTHVDGARVLELAEDLIAIPSPSGREHAAVAFTEQFLRAAGVPQVRRLPVAGAADTVVGRIPGATDRGGLLVAFHLDSAGPDPAQDPGAYRPRREGGRLHGVGAHDMKGGAACVLGAVEALLRGGARLRRPLVVAGTTDELGWSRGAHAAIRSGLLAGCNAALVGEWTARATFHRAARGRHIVVVRPGAGQAALPIARILRDAGERLAVSTADGQELRVSTSGLEVVVDAYVPPGRGADDVTAAVRTALAAAGLARGVVLEVDPRPTPAPKSYLVPAGSAIVAALAAAMRAQLGQEPREEIARNVSDANHFFWYGGIPTLIFGPAGDRPGPGIEFIEIDTLGPAARVYLRVMAAWLT